MSLPASEVCSGAKIRLKMIARKFCITLEKPVPQLEIGAI